MSKKDDKRRKRAKAKKRAGAGKLAHNRPDYKSPDTIAREAAEEERKLILRRRLQRTCGGCRLCCDFKSVAADDQEVNPSVPYAEAEVSKWKRAWTNCEHECEAGCAIFDDESRPSACGGYLCLWREGWGEDEDRPDKLGVLPEIGVSRAFHKIGSGEDGEQVMVVRARERDDFNVFEEKKNRFVERGGVVVYVTPKTQTIYGPKALAGITFSQEEIERLHDEAVARRRELNEGVEAEAAMEDDQ